MRLELLLLVLCGGLLCADTTGCCKPQKKLIEFGWDEPNTAFMRQHIVEMERTPFDGCVFHLSDDIQENYIWDCWGKRAFTEAELKPALDDLKATTFTRFTHNFLRFNTCLLEDVKLDWFDDFSAILNNACLAARIAREGKCKGILLDIEHYGKGLQIFNYNEQRDKDKKSWDEYAAQVCRRGYEVMVAFQQGFPDVTVFLTFGYSLPWRNLQDNIKKNGKSSLAECEYGLLAPFMDGMVAAAKGRTRLVDGYEFSYGNKDTTSFKPAYLMMKNDLLPIVANPKKYHQVISIGFGIWMDFGSNKAIPLSAGYVDWVSDLANLDKNYYPPDKFEASVRTALEVADEYVWIYTEQPRWWPKGTNNPPDAYDAALRHAR